MKPNVRVLAGFLVAPLLGVAVYPLLQEEALSQHWSFTARLLGPGLVIAYACALVLGVPAYLWLRRRGRLTVGRTLGAGALVAALPWALLALNTPQYSLVGDTLLVDDGHYTWAGITYTAAHIFRIAVCGAAAGILFWRIAA